MGVRRTTGNLLREDFHDTGRGMAAAKAAFSEIENATHVAKIDLSLASFLTPWKQEDGFVEATVFNGKQTILGGNKGIETDGIYNATVSLPNGYANEVNTILMDGGITQYAFSLSDPYAYVMNSNAFYQLSQILKLGYTAKMQDVIRDYAVSSECALLRDEYMINVVYREQNGVKQIAGIFVNEKTWPTLDELIDAASRIGEKIDKDFKIAGFDIKQKKRSINMTCDDGPGLTFTLSDCESRNVKAIYGKTWITVEGGKDIADALLEAIAA